MMRMKAIIGYSTAFNNVKKTTNSLKSAIKLSYLVYPGVLRRELYELITVGNLVPEKLDCQTGLK